MDAQALAAIAYIPCDPILGCKGLFVGVQHWTSLMLLTGLIMSLYAGLIESYTQRSVQSAKVRKDYLHLLRWMGCLLLLCCANVLKTLIAKMLSCHFYCSGYFDKMQDARRKVGGRSRAVCYFTSDTSSNASSSCCGAWHLLLIC